MTLKEVFFLCRETISPNIKYIKEVEKDKYEVHEYKKRNTSVYYLRIIDGKIEFVKET